VEQMPIEINGVILTERVLDALRDIQENKYESGLCFIEDLRKVSRVVINAALTEAHADYEEVFDRLSGLSMCEEFIENLLPYGYTLAKKEVCHE